MLEPLRQSRRAEATPPVAGDLCRRRIGVGLGERRRHGYVRPLDWTRGTGRSGERQDREYEQDRAASHPIGERAHYRKPDEIGDGDTQDHDLHFGVRHP